MCEVEGGREQESGGVDERSGEWETWRERVRVRCKNYYTDGTFGIAFDQHV